MNDLIIPLKGIYFDQIKEGSKLEEYRLVNDYWKKRLNGKTYDRIILTKGYPKSDDVARRLTVNWRGYTIKSITHPHFGNDPVEVFAIDVSSHACS